MNDAILSILDKARKTYGNKNQILVCMEELNELSCVLAKFPRYENEEEATKNLYEGVLDEAADVMIILEHVKSIFGISDKELEGRMGKKILRLERWLQHSDSMQETIDDREVDNNGMSKTENKYCTGCKYEKTIDGKIYINNCVPCLKAQATEGIAPFRKEK